MKIAVLSGGISPERDVSLSSGAMIATALCERGHSVAYTDILRCFDSKEISKAFKKDEKYSYSVQTSPPDLEDVRAKSKVGKGFIGKGILPLCESADVTFLALHGGAGEDGRISAVMESLGIRHTGSSFFSCHLAMDKQLSKVIFARAGVPVPRGIAFSGDALDEIPLPAVVKPVGCGSSIGVSIAYGKSDLRSAIESAAKYGGGIMVEEFIRGREFSVGILCGKPLPAIEIIPKNKRFYDYENKYKSGATLEVCPADLTEKQAQLLGDTALAAHNSLGLGAYSRLDFILEEKSGRFLCLEANALPGMTPSSLLPQEANAAGISYGRLCEMIADAAI